MSNGIDKNKGDTKKYLCAISDQFILFKCSSLRYPRVGQMLQIFTRTSRKPNANVT